MKVAVIGSRTITEIRLADHLPPAATELISGGAKGVDQLAGDYARTHGLTMTVIRPDYARYGHGAPLRRNRQIVDQCDLLLAFWDGVSRGTAYTIQYARQTGKPMQVIRLP